MLIIHLRIRCTLVSSLLQYAPPPPIYIQYSISFQFHLQSSRSQLKTPFSRRPSRKFCCTNLDQVEILYMEKLVFQNGVKKDQLLSAVNDYHGGVIVELKEPMDPNVFQNMLKASLSKWRLQGMKGVWIKLPIELVNLVETAVKEGFWYHHAEPHYLMLVYWIPETENTIPANASHRVGIGAIVLTDKRELLVVQENSGRLKGTAVWKIPTGIVEEGEDIFEGAIREVKEETGIDTEFMEVLAFRQTHKALFGKSDLFFICMMRPLSFDIQKQDLEIEAAQWMPIEEYAALPFVQKHGFFKYIKDLCLVKAERNYPGFTPVPITSFFDASTSFLYCNKDGLDQESSASSSLKEDLEIETCKTILI